MSRNKSKDFLSKAAAQYAIEIPSFGAYLSSRAHGDVPEPMIEYSSAGAVSCPGCRAALIPGLNAMLTLEKKGSFPKQTVRKKVSALQKAPDQGSSNFKMLTIECAACRRYVKYRVEKGCRQSGLAEEDKRSIHGASIGSPKRASQVESLARANRGSKQRAKARKQGGLQAMVENSKDESAKKIEPELSLMDLMKED